MSDIVLRDEPKLRDSFRAKFFTGLDKYDRETLWLFLDEDKWNLKLIDQDITSGDMTISVECQFLLTLAILRRDYVCTHHIFSRILTFLFGIVFQEEIEFC